MVGDVPLSSDASINVRTRGYNSEANHWLIQGAIPDGKLYVNADVNNSTYSAYDYFYDLSHMNILTYDSRSGGFKA